MDEIKEMRNQIRTLRWCNLITLAGFLIVSTIFQAQYLRIRSYYQETIRQSSEMISVLESQNSELYQILSVIESQNSEIQKTLLILGEILPD